MAITRYSKESNTVDPSDAPSVYRQHTRKEMLPFLPSGAQKVLDVGCNTGTFGKLVKDERGAEVWGVEPNAEAAAIAKTSLDVVVVDHFSTTTRVPDRYFDAVVFNDVLEHMVDPWSSLRIAGAKLREGGVVIASIPNLLFIGNVLHMLIERDFRYENTGIRDQTHVRFFTRKSLVRLFEQSGFSIDRIEGIREDWWTPSLLRRAVFRLFGQSLLQETKYMQFAVVAKPR